MAEKESRGPKRMKLDEEKQSNVSGSSSESESDSEDMFSDDDGSDISAEDFPSESDLSSQSTSSEDESSSDVNESNSISDKTDTIGKNTWTVVHPPEPAVDMKSKFRVTNVGPRNLPKSKYPMDFLSLFLTEELLTMMVDNTNAYARSVLEHNSETGNSKHWDSVTLDEMKKFWSILINMGLTQMSRYKDYWSTHPAMFMPFFAKVMPYQRFKSILSNFNLTNALSSPKSYSKLCPLVKIQSLLTSFNSAFKKFYVPEQEIRLDEGLIYSSKQSGCIIQYRPKKYLVQRGIQKLELCDSTSDYIVHVSLKRYRSGIKRDVVFDLLNEAQLTGKGYHLFIGKKYMDIKLSHKLLSTNTFLTGPVDKSNCGDFPHFVTRTYVKPGTTLYARSGDQLLIKYNVQKPVCLTTGGWAEDQSIENAKSQQRVRPLIIRRYLRYMSGKDKNSLHITCTIAINSFWKKMAFNLVDVAIFNAYLLYKSQRKNPLKCSKQKFLEDIVEQLSLVISPNTDVINSKGSHQLTRVRDGSNHACRVCKQDNGETFICTGCNVFAHELCFRALIHDKKKENRNTAIRPRQLSNDQVGPSNNEKDSIVEIIEVKVESSDED